MNKSINLLSILLCTTKPLEIFRVDFCSESNTNSKGKHHGCSNQSRYYSTQTTFLRSSVGWKSEWQRQRASCIQASEHATEAGPESSAKYQIQVEIDARIEFYEQIVHIHQAVEDVLVVFHVVEKAGCFERIQDKCQRIGDEKYDNQDDHHHRKAMLPELRTAHCGTQATSPENRVHNAAVDRRQREQRQAEHGEEIHPMDEDLYIEFIAAQQWNHTKRQKLYNTDVVVTTQRTATDRLALHRLLAANG
ncbi:hypothetical protein T06_2822 [Trichinella sp. T6]|nr:hypothetical protein T06_2822 [Trichinella sp. T6]